MADPALPFHEQRYAEGIHHFERGELEPALAAFSDFLRLTHQSALVAPDRVPYGLDVSGDDFERAFGALLDDRAREWTAHQRPWPRYLAGLEQERVRQNLVAGRKILFLLPRHIMNSAEFIEADLHDHLLETAASAGADVEWFPTDRCGYPGSDPDLTAVAAELDRLTGRIAAYAPDVVCVDGNYLPSEASLNPAYLGALKARYGFKIIVFIGDAWGRHWVPAADRWGETADLLFHFAPDTPLERVGRFPGRLCWSGYPVNERRFFPDPTKTADISFVGTYVSILRPFWLTVALQAARDLTLTHRLLPHKREAGVALPMDEYARVLRQSTMVLNFSTRIGPVRVMTGRTWQALTAGVVLLEEDNPCTPAYFVPFVHYIPFATRNELTCAIRFFSRHPEHVRRIGDAASAFCRAHYSAAAIWSRVIAAAYAAGRRGLVPERTWPAVPTAAYISAARGQRLVGNEHLALQILEVAVDLGADQAVRLEIARTHADAGNVDRALRMLDLAVARDPSFLEAHWERGVLLERRGEIDGALEAWRKADVFRDPHRHSLYLVAALKSAQSSDHSLLEAHRAWARRHALPADSCGPARFPAWSPGERINIGYACSFWDADTITYQMLPVLRRHDRHRFRVTAYVRGEPGPGVHAAVDEVRFVTGLSHQGYVRRVREDGMQILVELNGHSPGHWLAAMAARCAPVQVSYFNITATSGVEQMDYVLADPISVAPGADCFYVEQVHRLPGCFLFSSYEGAELPPVMEPPSMRKGYMTFGCFGSGPKINPGLVALWAEILRRVPDARFFVRNRELNAADNRRALARQFERHGIDPLRLLILQGTDRRGVLDSYAHVDIALDTFPYCGGNTTAEALWQGVPVITLKGDRFSSAYGAAVLTASGLADLIAETADEYVERAVDLAADRHRLLFYRTNLRRLVAEHGFSDADRYVRGLEAAYLDMLARVNTRLAVGHSG